MSMFKSVVWIPKRRPVPRAGLFGWFLDLLFGQESVLNPGGDRFIALDEHGNIATSQDGSHWTTQQSTAPIINVERLRAFLNDLPGEALVKNTGFTVHMPDGSPEKYIIVTEADIYVSQDISGANWTRRGKGWEQ